MEREKLPQRRSIRLKDYDYSQPGAYFVTICTENHRCLFGDIYDYQIHLNQYGIIVRDSWLWLASQYPYVSLDEWIVMPNHLHGIIVIGERPAGGSRTAPTVVTKVKPLGSLVGAFKTVSTKRLNELDKTPGATIWQRNYYEHIIRNEDDLAEIREYISNNPSRWAEDKYNPDCVVKIQEL